MNKMSDNFTVMSIDEFADVCGYFTSETDANNGYGCNHPEQEEFEMLHKDKDGYTHRGYPPSKNKTKQGKCYPLSCPLANICDMQDLKEYDKEEYDRIKSKYPDCDDEDLDIEASSTDLMLVNEDDLKKESEEQK
jgi:hypothetical protein